MDCKNLYRKDLTKDRRFLSIENITIDSFKESSLTWDECCHFDKIIFIDEDNRSKILKNRYGPE